MAFKEVQLPTAIALDGRGGPGFNTSVVIAQSGHEQRNVNWSQARRKYDIGFVNKSQSYVDTLEAFFYAIAQGKAYGFRFRDRADNAVTLQTLGTGNGTPQTFQLIKTYTVASNTYTRTITKPVTASVKDANGNSATNTVRVFYGSSEQMSGWTMAHATGILSTTAATNGQPVKVTCQFDVPVRFDIDDLGALTWHMPEGAASRFSLPSIPLLEIRI